MSGFLGEKARQIIPRRECWTSEQENEEEEEDDNDDDDEDDENEEEGERQALARPEEGKLGIAVKIYVITFGHLQRKNDQGEQQKKAQ